MGKENAARKRLRGNPQGWNTVNSKDTTTEPLGKTAQRIADEHGVGYGTVVRAEEFAKGLDALGEYEPELKAEILSGKTGAIKKDIQALAKLPEPERPAAIEKIKRGERVTPSVEPPREVAPITIDNVANTIDRTFQEFMDTLDMMLDMYRDRIDTAPKRIVAVIRANNQTVRAMLEKLEGGLYGN